MGDRRPVQLAGRQPGDPPRLAALVEGCGLRARPLRQARGWGYQRLSALGTIIVVDAAPPPPPRMAATGCASTLAMEMSDGAQRLVVNCGGRARANRLSDELVQALRHRRPFDLVLRHQFDRDPARRQPRQGRRRRRHRAREDNDCSRIEASHDGYVKGFGLIHQRRLSLGNDGKEVRGEDRLTPRGRREIREAAPFAIRFHLAPGVEATVTADGMGAILRSRGRAAVEFPLPRGDAAGRGKPVHRRPRPAVPTLQLVVVGEVSAIGGEIAWQFRRSS